MGTVLSFRLLSPAHKMLENISLVAFLLVFMICKVPQLCLAESLQDQFYVKPGGQAMIFEKEWKGFKCTFEYKAQGGTHEQWQVSIEDDGGNVMCTIARGQTSYLFFETFKMSLSGGGLKLEQFEAINTGNTPLAESEYKVDKRANTLSAAQGQFKNHLERIILLASSGKSEL